MILVVINDDLFGFPAFVEFAKFFRECVKNSVDLTLLNLVFDWHGISNVYKPYLQCKILLYYEKKVWYGDPESYLENK